jgi:hypothetical protein
VVFSLRYGLTSEIFLDELRRQRTNAILVRVSLVCVTAHIFRPLLSFLHDRFTSWQLTAERTVAPVFTKTCQLIAK